MRLTELVGFLVQQILIEQNDSGTEEDPGTAAETDVSSDLLRNGPAVQLQCPCYLHDVDGRVKGGLGGFALGLLVGGGQHGAVAVVVIAVIVVIGGHG